MNTASPIAHKASEIARFPLAPPAARQGVEVRCFSMSLDCTQRTGETADLTASAGSHSSVIPRHDRACRLVARRISGQRPGVVTTLASTGPATSRTCEPTIATRRAPNSRALARAYSCD